MSSFNREELEFMKEQELQQRLLQSQNNSIQMNQAQQSMMLGEQEKNLIDSQLDLTEELELIENLLKGRVLKRDEYGSKVWEDPKDTNMIVLTPYGIHLIMNTITFYINKNTLLSNYDDEKINLKMRDFAIELIDTVFMEYDKVFQYPTLDDCIAEFKRRIDRKTALRKFAYEITGKEVDVENIREEFILEIEYKLENELEKIREKIVKDKLKRFGLLMRAVQDAVHSTYLRAWNGQERRTLRQHIHISESVTPMMNGKQKGSSKLNPFSWGSK